MHRQQDGIAARVGEREKTLPCWNLRLFTLLMSLQGSKPIYCLSWRCSRTVPCRNQGRRHLTNGSVTPCAFKRYQKICVIMLQE